MSHEFPAVGGVQFDYGPWHIGLWMEDTGIGDGLFVGNYIVGLGWESLGPPIAGPYTADEWIARCQQAGGMGNIIVGLFPKINLVLATYYNTHPALPVETNATPYTQQDFNDVLFEYIGLHIDGTNTAPTAYVHPYTP